jgi:hypothetical protein
MFGSYLQLFVGGPMCYIRYLLCLLADNGVQHILCYVLIFPGEKLVYTHFSGGRMSRGKNEYVTPVTRNLSLFANKTHFKIIVWVS